MDFETLVRSCQDRATMIDLGCQVGLEPKNSSIEILRTKILAKLSRGVDPWDESNWVGPKIPGAAYDRKTTQTGNGITRKTRLPWNLDDWGDYGNIRPGS